MIQLPYTSVISGPDEMSFWIVQWKTNRERLNRVLLDLLSQSIHLTDSHTTNTVNAYYQFPRPRAATLTGLPPHFSFERPELWLFQQPWFEKPRARRAGCRALVDVMPGSVRLVFEKLNFDDAAEVELSAGSALLQGVFHRSDYLSDKPIVQASGRPPRNSCQRKKY